MQRRISSFGSWLGLACLVACGGARGAGQLTAAGPIHEATGRCGRWVVGAEAMVRSQPTLILEGGQGTVEAPRFLGELACQLAQHRPVVVAVEWPRNLASAVNLMVSGSKSAEARLRNDAMWTAAPTRTAGLATTAMWELLVQVQTWHGAGIDLTLVPFGPNPVDENGGYQPDESSELYNQVEQLGEVRRRAPDAAIIVWVGVEQGGRQGKGGPEMSLASHLESAGIKAVSFQLEPPADSGQGAVAAATSAMPAATPHALAAPDAAPWALERRSGLAGYDGVFRIGATSPSAPFAADEPANAPAAAP
jgi:hypothetical protein